MGFTTGVQKNSASIWLESTLPRISSPSSSPPCKDSVKTGESITSCFHIMITVDISQIFTDGSVLPSFRYASPRPMSPSIGLPKKPVNRYSRSAPPMMISKPGRSPTWTFSTYAAPVAFPTPYVEVKFVNGLAENSWPGFPFAWQVAQTPCTGQQVADVVGTHRGPEPRSMLTGTSLASLPSEMFTSKIPPPKKPVTATRSEDLGD
mmetsp:Transcript_115123/g.308694  ORF Transcript_115123/g.308694 Transcript_115123/m.308694 type:complete len:206 (-) Transcript_115123:72-689(-)